MDLQHLRCFLAVAEDLHFGRAAERLHLTPSPVSRNIKELERSMGTALFVRRYHSVELTSAGAALVEPVRQILGNVSTLRRTAQAAASESTQRDVIRIGVSHVAHPALVGEVMDEARRCSDRFEFQITASISADLLDELEQENLDFAIVHTPAEHDAMEFVLLADYEMVAAVRQDDALAGRESLRREDLAGRTIVTQPLNLQPASWRAAREAWRDAGVTSFHEIPMTDPALFASYVKHAGEIDVRPRFASGVYQDPAFALVPMAGPDIKWGAAVGWRRDAIAGDDALGEIAKRLTERFAESPLHY